MVSINRAYFQCSGPCLSRGILKIIIMVLSLAAMISALTLVGLPIRKGWLGFVSGIVLTTEFIWFLLYLCGVNEKFPSRLYVVELISLIVYIVLVVIAAIVAAVAVPLSVISLTAYCVFAFALMPFLIWDMILFVSQWRVVQRSQTTTTTTTTTATTKTTHEEEARY